MFACPRVSGKKLRKCKKESNKRVRQERRNQNVINKRKKYKEE
jgi:hypothetical protein